MEVKFPTALRLSLRMDEIIPAMDLHDVQSPGGIESM
jgi:hypothetical protein